MSGSKVSPAGAAKPVLTPLIRARGTGDPLTSSELSNLATLKIATELATPRPPALSSDTPLGEFKLGICAFLPTLFGLMVTAGVWLPAVDKSLLANSTIV